MIVSQNFLSDKVLRLQIGLGKNRSTETHFDSGVGCIFCEALGGMSLSYEHHVWKGV